jgi:hypothetical protein
MKLLCFLLSAAATASVAHASKSLARQLIERHVQSDEDLEAAMMSFQIGSDWTCMMKGAIDEATCETQDSGCSWCPLGSMIGTCVSMDQADAVNGLEIPHVQCGAPSPPDDQDFWDGLVGCEMAGATYMDCLGNSLCTWCVVDEEPSFGLCMSQDFIDLADTMSLQEQDSSSDLSSDFVEPIWEDFVKCSQDPPLDPLIQKVTGLVDFTCIVQGALGQQACVEGVDGAGNLCVFQDSDIFGELCLSATQTNVMEWFMDAFDRFGLDIEGLMNGDIDINDAMDYLMLGGDTQDYPVPQEQVDEEEEEDYYNSDEEEEEDYYNSPYNTAVDPPMDTTPSLAQSILDSAVSNIALGEDVQEEHTTHNGGGRA